MERYTHFEDGKWRLRIGDTEHSGPWVDRLAAYEDTGLDPGEIDEALNEAHDLGYQACLNYKGSTWPEAAELQAYRTLGPVEELSALVKARGEGRVVVLPCKVGDTVYRPQLAESVPLKEMVCCGYRIYEGGINVMCKESGIEFPLIFTLGKTAYLTRAEAEAAIGGGGDG